jgi:uncharacterized membrane protein (UPF0127 family)
MPNMKNSLRLLVRTLQMCAIFALFPIGSSGCSTPTGRLPTVNAYFVRPDGSTTERFSLEVAATEAHRRKGLMYRREMSESEGMLFLFPTERQNSFWMKNTILSLDMIFIGKDWRVVGILDHVPPQNEAPRQIEKPNQYVIELGSGVAEKFSISVGARVVVEGELPSAQ